MKTQLTPALAATAAFATSTALNVHAESVEELIAKIKSKDDKIRGPAWQGAGPLGAPALKPLAAVMTDADMEIARAAKRALWKIVWHVGRPNAAAEKKAAVTELIPLLAAGPSNVIRREVLWMLSEIGGDESVEPVAALLGDAELREDARMVLQRIPGKRSLAALKAGLAAAPVDFKPNLAQSLRVRGEKIKEYPSQKLVPIKPTNIKSAKQI